MDTQHLPFPALRVYMECLGSRADRPGGPSGCPRPV